MSKLEPDSDPVNEPWRELMEWWRDSPEKRERERYRTMLDDDWAEKLALSLRALGGAATSCRDTGFIPW